MKFLVVAVIVLFAFVELSKANKTATLLQSTEIEKFLVSKEFQEVEDALIMAGKDAESVASRASILAIKQAAVQCQASGVPAAVVKTVLEGILNSVRLVVASAQKAYGAIEAAQNLTADPIAATNIIKSGFNSDSDLVLVAGVSIEDAFGAGLSLVGGAAKESMEKAIIATQKAGNAALEILEIAKAIATFGIKAGGPAAIEGCKAAKETCGTASLTVLHYINEAARYAFEGLRNAIPKNPLNLVADRVPGIIASLKTNVTTTHPVALEAISKITNGLTSASKNLKKKPSIGAAKIFSEGLISTIKQTADAVDVAKKSIEGAAKLALQDVEAAIAFLRKGIKAGQDEILSGSAPAYLGIGAAGEMLGQVAVEGFIPAVIEIELGREAAYEDLALAEKTAIIGFEAGGLALVQGAFAATQTCDAALTALADQLADGAEIAFAVVLKA